MCSDSEPSDLAQPLQLDRPCSDDHLAIIAEDLTEWEMIAYVLGVSEAEVEEVDLAFQSLPLKRIKMLMKWKNKYKENATYHRLITAFSFLDRCDMAERVRELSTTPSSGGVHHSSPFADHLKTWYTHTDPSANLWPLIHRGKFCKLAIVSVNLKKKVPIDLPNIFDDSILKKKLNGKKMILIEGAPGSGKSTLLWYMCQKWASSEMFQEFSLVIYIKLREYSTIQSPRSVADILPCSSKIKNGACNEIEADDGKGVLFLLDGWDELPKSLQSNSIFKDIVTSSPKHSLLHSTVVVTSRYVSSDELHGLATSRLETLGFADQEVKECIMDIIGNEEAAHALMEALESRPSLLSSCHLPLNAMIITHVFQVKMHNLPNTLLETFKLLILNCIQRHVINREDHEDVTTLESLPTELQASFYPLCELAFRGLLEDRMLFSKEEMKSIPDTLSLLYGIKLHDEIGPKMKYSFLHQTIQELLAAIHMSRMPPDEQLDYFQNFYAQERLHALIQLYAGVTSLHLIETVSILSGSVVCSMSAFNTNESAFICATSQKVKNLLFSQLAIPELSRDVFDSVYEEGMKIILLKQSAEPTNESAICRLPNGRHDNEKFMDTSFKELGKDTQSTAYSYGRELRLLANCLYEANNPALYKLVENVDSEIVNVPLTPSDCLSLGCLIAKLHNKYVRFSGCDLSSNCIKSFKQGLGESSCIGELEIIDPSFDEQSIKYLSELIIRNSNLHKLSLSFFNLEHKGLKYILSALKSCPIRTLILATSNVQVDDNNGSVLQEFIIETPSLETLFLSNNFLMGDIGANYIGLALKNNKSLRTLHLSQCGITSNGIMPLCESLKMNTSLTDLDLCNNNLCDDGITCLCLSLMTNHTLTRLNVKRCGFTSFGIGKLVQILSYNKTIVTILWDGNVMKTTEEVKQCLKELGLLTPTVAAVMFGCVF